MKGIEEADITNGFVLCDPRDPIKTGTIFDAQVSSSLPERLSEGRIECLLH